jgi:hypothetical protein
MTFGHCLRRHAASTCGVRAWKDDEATRVAPGHLAVAPDLMQINLPPLQSGKLRRD